MSVKNLEKKRIAFDPLKAIPFKSIFTYSNLAKIKEICETRTSTHRVHLLIFETVFVFCIK